MNICHIRIHEALDKNLSETMVICMFLCSLGWVRHILGERMMNLVHNVIYVALQPCFLGYCPFESDKRTGFQTLHPSKLSFLSVCFCLFCWHCDGGVWCCKWLDLLQSFYLYLWLAVIKTEPTFITMNSACRYHKFNFIKMYWDITHLMIKWYLVCFVDAS